MSRRANGLKNALQRIYGVLAKQQTTHKVHARNTGIIQSQGVQGKKALTTLGAEDAPKEIDSKTIQSSEMRPNCADGDIQAREYTLIGMQRIQSSIKTHYTAHTTNRLTSSETIILKL